MIMGEVVQRKERKELEKHLIERFGLPENFSFNGGLLKTGKGRIWLITNDLNKVSLEGLRVEFMGVYLGFYSGDDMRLSIEASQIIAKNASKNVVELTSEEFNEWVLGGNITSKRMKKINATPGFVIIKHKRYVYGSGKYTGEKIINMVPKQRRIPIKTLRGPA